MIGPRGQAAPDAEPRRTAGEETVVATRNALKLSGSLLGTWGIALVMRFLLPRLLGPDRYGALGFADAFAATFFLVLGLGLDLYVRKSVSLNTEHASDFFGGTLVLRGLLAAGVLLTMAVVMNALGRPPEARHAVYVFSFAQFFVTTNATLSAMLHAKGEVSGMSVLAVATKVLWAIGLLAAIGLGAGLWAFAAAYLLSEAVESVVLFQLAARHLGLVFRVDVRATKVVLVSSLPYFLNAFATAGYGKLDVTLLAFLSTSVEVGYYVAAGAIASLSLMATPLIGWVLMPTLARAAARSHDELFDRLRGSSELILAVTIPVALLLALGADVFVRLLFGHAFAPAAQALRILAPTIVVTYLAIVHALALLMLERPWSLTAISVGGLVVNVALNLAFITPALSRFGRGGGGVGCALSMLGTELFVTASMATVVGRRALNVGTLRMIGKTFLACGLVAGVDRILLGVGPVRLAVDAALYVALVVAAKAVPVTEVADAVRAALGRRGAGATPASVSASGS